MAINKDFLVKNGLQVGGNTQITGSLTAAGLVYPVSDGDEYHAMVTDGTGNLSFASVDTVESNVTNQTGSLIPKGTPVYQTGAAGQTLTIAPSDASDPNTMPSIGVAASDIADGDTGRVIHSGYIKGVDTSAFNEGDRIYVADGGGYQVDRPAGEDHIVQFLGVVTKVHATNGSGVVFNTASAYSVPNLNDGNIFIGDSTNTYTTATLDTSIVPENTNLYFTDQRAKSAIESSTHLTVDGGTFYIDTDANRIGINDTSPQHALDVTGSIGIAGTEVIDSGGEVVTARLKDSGVTANTYGSASQVPVITIDAKGRITSASTTSVAGVSSFTYNSSTNNLNISTADGGSFDADISAIGGSIQGTLADTKVQYGVNYSGTPQQGSFFFDSLNQKLKVYTGTEFVDAVPAGSGGGGGGETTDAVATFEKYTYSIPSATNAISGTDDNGNQLAYVVDGSQNVELYVNGIKQVEGATNDYVATTGTSVTLTYNLAAGDVVDVQVYELLTQDAFYLKSETFTKTETNTQISNAIADYVPLAGGTMTGPLATTKITVDGTTLVTDSDNNRVGIGTASPSAKAHIIVDPTTATVNTLGYWDNDHFTVSSSAANNALGFGVAINDDNSSAHLYVAKATASWETMYLHASDFKFYSGASNSVNISADGYLGIGVNATHGIETATQLGVKASYFQPINSDYVSYSGTTPTIHSTASGSLAFSMAGVNEMVKWNDVAGHIFKMPSKQIVLNATSTTDYTGVLLQHAGSNRGWFGVAGTTGHFSNAAVQNDVVIRSESNLILAAGGSDDRVYIASDGKVGIGDSAPARALDIGSPGNALGQLIFSDIGSDSYGNPGAFNTNSNGDKVILYTDGSTSYDGRIGVGSSSNMWVKSYGNTAGVGKFEIYTGGSKTATFDGNGNLGIGVSSPTYKLEVEGNSRINGTSDALTVNTVRAGTLISMRLNGVQEGTIDVTTSGTTYNTTSDRRLKDNITAIVDGKEKLLAMNPVTFSFKADPEEAIVSGFIAQEMAEVVPEAVTGEPDGERMMSMDYGRITPTIVAALQDALREIEELKERIKTLEAK
jgi:hypothetical protein